MSTIPGVQVQGDGNQPTSYYAACENDGCGVCGPMRRTEGAAHSDAREHALVCSRAGSTFGAALGKRASLRLSDAKALS